jgi:FkbM family methyltransferase
MKRIIKKVIHSVGFDLVKIQNPVLPEKPKYFEKTEENLDYYATPIGNYYVPNNAPNDVVINHMKEGKYFEEEVIKAASKLIKRGSTVLDVGSNFGQMAVHFSKLVGDEGKVYAFEADDFVFEVLKKNIDANNCKNIIPVFGAVHNEAGKELIFPKQDFKRFQAYGSYGIDPLANDGRRVPTVHIDSMDLQGEISFIKVDIQGSDLFALQGAKETIRKHKPSVLFEFEQQFQKEFKTTFQDYVNFVSEVNYKFDEIIMEINYLISAK